MIKISILVHFCHECLKAKPSVTPTFYQKAFKTCLMTNIINTIKEYTSSLLF